MLLIPISEILEVTVTELLKGERIDTKKDMDAEEVETLVVGSLELSVQDMIKKRKTKWKIAYLSCVLIIFIELILFTVSNMELELLCDSLKVSGVMLIFATWLCLFAKELPTYYDGNKIIRYTSIESFSKQGTNIHSRISALFLSSIYMLFVTWKRE